MQKNHNVYIVLHMNGNKKKERNRGSFGIRGFKKKNFRAGNQVI